jgi:uncharacterized membrane protein
VQATGPTPATAAPPGVTWRQDRAGLVAAALTGVVLAVASTLRWRHHWAGALDLGLFDQGVWMLSRLHSPDLTILPENLFGDHFSPVLVLYAPLYRFHPSPGWLLVSQALAVGATVVPMRVLARDLGAPPALATVAVIASAPILTATLFDFHPVVLTLPVVTAALVTARRDDVRTTVLLAVAVALIRADAAVLLLGVAVVATPRVRRAIVPVALVSMAVGALVPVLLDTDQTFERYYGSLGTGPIDALTHPWRVVTTLLGSQARRTLFLWLLPVGFLPLARPRWLAALVVGGLPILLSTHPNTAVPWFHHAGTVAPFAIAGALATIGHHRTHVAPRALLVCGLVLALVLQGPLMPDGPRSQTWRLVRPRPVVGLAEALAQVGPAEGVAAETWIVVELARRDRVYPLACEDEPAECGIPGPPGAVVDVVIADGSRTAVLEAAGWRVEPVAVPGSDLVVARP